MSTRRFTDKPDLEPTAVRGLASNHPAIVEGRTLFPNTVVEVTATQPDRLLVSGLNNRKLGDVVEKGRFQGFALYGLSIEERATCPSDCSVKTYCYGNGMQMARRHRIGDANVFFDRLSAEIVQLLAERDGLLIRLHVLGDFPSVEYVAFWKDVLDDHPNVACYGYTHRCLTELGGDEIGDAIDAVKLAHPDRFRIRWSSDQARPDGAVVIDRLPTSARVAEGLVCPAQTDATACCATCGFCWEPAASNDCVVFIKHGPKALGLVAEAAMAPAAAAPSTESKTERVRAVKAIALPAGWKPAPVTSATPLVRLVNPADLRVETSYQRDLSAKSIRLIRKIVIGWDWSRFKPPVCAETADGLFVIDGQHTAIAAATHPTVVEIPVLVVQASRVETRAASFVSHNRDRLVMSPLQVFHAEVAAGDRTAVGILKLAITAGLSIPRSPPMKGNAKPGQLIAINAVREAYGSSPDLTGRVLKICASAQVATISALLVRALLMLCRDGPFRSAAALPDEAIAAAVRSIADFERAARAYAAESEQGRSRAGAMLIARAAGVQSMAEAA